MTTIQGIATVMEDGSILLRPQAKPNIPPGEHRVVIIIEEKGVEQEKPILADYPVIQVDSWPENFTLRREEIYEDDGR